MKAYYSWRWIQTDKSNSHISHIFSNYYNTDNMSPPQRCIVMDLGLINILAHLQVIQADILAKNPKRNLKKFVSFECFPISGCADWLMQSLGARPVFLLRSIVQTAVGRSVLFLLLALPINMSLYHRVQRWLLIPFDIYFSLYKKVL